MPECLISCWWSLLGLLLEIPEPIIPLVLHVLSLGLHVLCLVLHVLYPPPLFYPYFFYPQLFCANPFFLHHFIFNPTFLPALLKSWSSGKFIDLSESRKPKAESQKPRAESRKQRAVLIWDLFDFSWDLVVLAMFCRCIPALRGPRREPPCIDGMVVVMDGRTGRQSRKKSCIFNIYQKLFDIFS